MSTTTSSDAGRPAGAEPPGLLTSHDRSLSLVIGACAAALLVAIGSPALWGQVYTDTDLGNFHLPMRHFYAEALASGTSFLWFPWTYTGFYLHGEGQASLLHPLNWLSYRALPLVPAFTLELVRNYVFLFLGTTLFARRLALPSHAALFAALLFAFGSFNMLHFVHLNAIAIIAHMPFMLWCIDVFLRASEARQRALTALGIALLTASQLLFGHPQFTWMSLLLCGLFALYTALRVKRPQALGWLAVAVGLGAGLAAVQLVPQLESLGQSFRGRPEEGYADTFALHPANVLQLVAPYALRTRVIGRETNEFALYAGAAVPVLIAWVSMRRRALGAAWPIVIAALSVAGLSLVLALGEAGQIYRIQQLLPLLGGLRAPTRYIVLFQFCAAIVAAIGWHDLSRLRHRPGSLAPVLLPLGLSLAATAYWAFANRLGLPTPEHARIGPLPLLLAGPALIGAATLLVVAAARRHRAALIVLAVLTAGDLGSYGLSYLRRFPPSEIPAYLAKWKVPEMPSDRRLNWGPPALTMRGIRLANGYAAMVPDRVLPVGDFTMPAVDLAVLQASLRVANVDHAYQRPLPDRLPRARLVSDAVVSLAPLKDIASIDLRTTALVFEPVDLGGGEPGNATLVRDDPGEIHLSVEAPGRQLAVVAESHHPGWTAQVDGAPCPVVRVYGDFLGCVVEPGRHAVVFRFEPASFRDGTRISIGAAVLTGLFAALVLRIRPPTPRGTG